MSWLERCHLFLVRKPCHVCHSLSSESIAGRKDILKTSNPAGSLEAAPALKNKMRFLLVSHPTAQQTAKISQDVGEEILSIPHAPLCPEMLLAVCSPLRWPKLKMQHFFLFPEIILSQKHGWTKSASLKILYSTWREERCIAFCTANHLNIHIRYFCFQKSFLWQPTARNFCVSASTFIRLDQLLFSNHSLVTPIQLQISLPSQYRASPPSLAPIPWLIHINQPGAQQTKALCFSSIPHLP